MQTISAHEHTHTHITNGSERTQQCAWSTAAASKTSKKRNYSITKHFLEWAYIRQRLNICMCMYEYVCVCAGGILIYTAGARTWPSKADKRFYFRRQQQTSDITLLVSLTVLWYPTIATLTVSALVTSSTWPAHQYCRYSASSLKISVCKERTMLPLGISMACTIV